MKVTWKVIPNKIETQAKEKTWKNSKKEKSESYP